ncbi:hypothetical protein FZC84_15490 [Rossellomorea vietnamensis]|uniref:Uncharacterized protein n=1 Tax=Rossellomorea vietnamensis TaxID=218284 RepID=A0A5D4M9S2_9BACI|nr:hypothetical protein FZC84_15490 [Rossellomorea vietnamensis]
MSDLLREQRAGETPQAKPRRLTARPAESSILERKSTNPFRKSKVIETVIYFLSKKEAPHNEF